jgi:hypothetical protein
MGRPRRMASRRMRAMSWKPSRRGMSSAVSLECRTLSFASNRYRPVADNSWWCFPRNQEQAVTVA